MPGAGAAPAQAAAVAAVTTPMAAPAAMAPPLGQEYRPGRAHRTPPPAYPGRTTAPRRTTVRLATFPRGPTTVVRRAAPPPRTTTSIMELSCLSSPCSSPRGPATNAAADVVVQEVVARTRPAQTIPAQIVPVKVRDGWLRRAKTAGVERITNPFRCCSRRAAEKSKQSAPLTYLHLAGATTSGLWTVEM
jgi:hypothetical protein